MISTLTMNAAVLSAQEQSIEKGSKVLHGRVTNRELRMYEAIWTYGPPRVALERAVYFRESVKTTEGQPLILRWANCNAKDFTPNFVKTLPG